jgi:alpha-glucosidase
MDTSIPNHTGEPMNLEALFSDGTSDYVIPPEPKVNQWIKIRFRTAKEDVDSVLVNIEDRGHKMNKVDSNDLFDYYELEWRTTELMLIYTFTIKKGEEIVYYNYLGVIQEDVEAYPFRVQPGFSTPDWAKGAVMYQIFVDRFYNGDLSNDVVDREYIYINQPSEQVKDWNAPIAPMDVARFYGGDLAGVFKKLDYLQELGIEVVYFNPIFVSPSNHKYDTQDYDHVDPHYGVIVNDGGQVVPEGEVDNTHATKYQKRVCDLENLAASNQLFKDLVAEMHKRGMRVIIDGVFNHCGSFNKWMDRERIYEKLDAYKEGAYVSGDSEYRNFFRFHKEEDEDWPYNDTYDGWWGHDTLPKLNYESSGYLRRHIFHIARKWVSPEIGVDGWRLDVASDLAHWKENNHIFWRKFRNEVKDANPQALILAEHYGNPSDWLQGDQWDTVMNYDAFMDPISWFLTGMEKHSDEKREDLKNNSKAFVESITCNMSTMLTPSLQVAMNEISNHDHSRFLTRTNGMVGRVDELGHKAAEVGVNYGIMREAVVFQMTWVGAPTIYYGDEAGLCGFTDPDNRRTYPWGYENHDLIDFHKIMIKIHKESPALRTGSLRILTHGEGTLSYVRFNRNEQVVVALNNTDKIKELTIPVWIGELPKSGVMKRLIYSYEEGYQTEPEKVIIQDGEVVIPMGAYSAMVLKSAIPKDFEKEFWR